MLVNINRRRHAFIVSVKTVGSRKSIVPATRPPTRALTTPLRHRTVRRNGVMPLSPVGVIPVRAKASTTAVKTVVSKAKANAAAKT